MSELPSLRLTGRVSVVTGGARGIGYACATALAAAGSDIALCDLDEGAAAQAAQKLADAHGVRARGYAANVTVPAQVQAAVKRIIADLGAIDHLVNNAGGQFAAPLAAISQKGFDTVVRTNLTGGFLMARECFTQWMAGHGGSIVNIVADMWNGMPGMGHSGAARAGMVNFTETAALEWSGANVRVNAVAPGWIASSGLDNYPPEMREHIRNLKKLSPLGRIGTESEVSAAVVFLLSEAASFITGATLRVDGGVPLTRPSRPMPKHASPAPAFNGFHMARLPDVLRD